MIGSTPRPGGNRKLPIRSPPCEWLLSKLTMATHVNQEVERHSAPGETRHQSLDDLQGTSSGRKTVVWSSPGSHPRRKTDRGRPQREGDRKSSQALRRLVRVWRREVGHEVPQNWTMHSGTEGQYGGRTFEVGARMRSGTCDNPLVQPLAFSYINYSLIAIYSMAFLLVHFVLLYYLRLRRRWSLHPSL